MSITIAWYDIELKSWQHFNRSDLKMSPAL